MDWTYREIHRQPQTFRETLHALNAEKNRFFSFLEESFDEFIFTGCGTSYNLSLTAAHLWQSIAYIPARGVPASEVFLFPQGILLPARRYLFFAISRSGETTETVKALEFFASSCTGKTVGVTCEPHSTLAQRAESALVFPSAHEESVVMTQSFSTMLLGLLFGALTSQKREAILSPLPEMVERSLLHEEKTVQDLASSSHFHKFIFLGNGPYYGIAWEGSLKLKEMSLAPTETFHFLEFRHGPKSIVDEHTLIVALTSSSAFSYEKEVLQEMVGLGASIFHLGAQSLSLPRTTEILFGEAGKEDPLRLILDVVFLQLLGYFRAKHQGLNPDEPRHLTKVVKL